MRHKCDFAFQMVQVPYVFSRLRVHVSYIWCKLGFLHFIVTEMYQRYPRELIYEIVKFRYIHTHKTQSFYPTCPVCLILQLNNQTF